MNLTASQSLGFLKLLAHDIRWQLVSALLTGDYRVQELVEQVGQPMNLVSYHLKHLRDQQLVYARRSDADGRDMYYSLNQDQLKVMYREAGEALRVVEETPPAAEIPQPARVLFLCTGNSARSQIAEGLMRQISKGQVEVFSAGSHPSEVKPLAVEVMEDFGIDISQQTSKHFDQFQGQPFDYVITVCDKVREICPPFTDKTEFIHWSMPDPATYKEFQEVARLLRTRIQYFLLTLHHKRAS